MPSCYSSLESLSMEEVGFLLIHWIRVTSGRESSDSLYSFWWFTSWPCLPNRAERWERGTGRGWLLHTAWGILIPCHIRMGKQVTDLICSVSTAWQGNYLILNNAITFCLNLAFQNCTLFCAVLVSAHTEEPCLLQMWSGHAIEVWCSGRGSSYISHRKQENSFCGEIRNLYLKHNSWKWKMSNTLMHNLISVNFVVTLVTQFTGEVKHCHLVCVLAVQCASSSGSSPQRQSAMALLSVSSLFLLPAFVSLVPAELGQCLPAQQLACPVQLPQQLCSPISTFVSPCWDQGLGMCFTTVSVLSPWYYLLHNLSFPFQYLLKHAVHILPQWELAKGPAW